MSRRIALSYGLVLVLAWKSASLAHAQADVPADNRADLPSPPPRPDVEGAQEPARRLFDAIVRDQPELAADFFFPREAFVKVKAMARPERYHARLWQRFVSDVHALHRGLTQAESATFERLALSRRGGWVRPGDEGNRLPYWAARHARLIYRVGGKQHELEVRVLISWGPRWYVIHLSDF
jgi:hypothetical protein